MFEKLRTLLQGHGTRMRHCPVCEHPVRTFLPLPAFYAEAARKYGYPHFGKGETINVAEYSCPHCRASDRERLYALFLDEIVSAPTYFRGRNLVHFAPEQPLSIRIRRLGAFNYRTADLFMEGVDDRVDITDMAEYANDSFDCFICSHVLEHVSDDRQTLCELLRILKPGGWGILMAPIMTHLEHTLEDPTATTEAERWRLFGQGDHVRLYAKGDFLHRIRETGFTVQELDVKHFGAERFDRYGITRRSVLYVVNKPYD